MRLPQSSSARRWRLNWKKSNPRWERVCVIANSVVSNRQARLATKAEIKRHLCLALDDVEERALGIQDVAAGTRSEEAHEYENQILNVRRVRLSDLFGEGLLEDGAQFTNESNGNTHRALFRAPSFLDYKIDGIPRSSDNPSKPLSDLCNCSMNGWANWIVHQGGKVLALDDIRQKHVQA
jgi:hypothetical protein